MIFEITDNSYFGELIDTDPMVPKVLVKYGLDFRCGGQRSLTDACKKSKVDIDLIFHKLKAT